MAGPGTYRKKRQQGVIDTLASGAWRVRVNVGVNPVAKQRHRRTRVIPARYTGLGGREGSDPAAQRGLPAPQPRTEAKVSQLIERYLNDFDGAWSTVESYRMLWQKHVEPFLGDEKVGDMEADTLESLYRELKRCREHCTRRYLQHRTSRQHECDQRCRQHVYTPLGTSARRQIHWLEPGVMSCALCDGPTW